MYLIKWLFDFNGKLNEGPVSFAKLPNFCPAMDIFLFGPLMSTFNDKLLANTLYID